MHPDDVADLVGATVPDLRAALAEAPELRCGDASYDGRAEIRIPMRKRAAQLLPMPALPRLPVLGAREPLAAGPSFALVTRPQTDREFIVVLDCSDWDFKPPLLDLSWPNGVRFTPPEWPRGRGFVAGHAKYNRPFICRPGLREYHEHPQHAEDAWDRYRESETLPGILIPILHDLQRDWVLFA